MQAKWNLKRLKQKKLRINSKNEIEKGSVSCVMLEAFVTEGEEKRREHTKAKEAQQKSVRAHTKHTTTQRGAGGESEKNGVDLPRLRESEPIFSEQECTGSVLFPNKSSIPGISSRVVY